MLDAHITNGSSLSSGSSGETASRSEHTLELNALVTKGSYSRARVLEIAQHYIDASFEETSDNSELSFALKTAAERLGITDNEVVIRAATNITLGSIGW